MSDYLAFEEMARRRGASELQQLWQTLYADRHPDVFECYFRIGGEPPDTEAALARLIRSRAPLEERARRTNELIRSHAARVCQLLDAGPIELPYVVMVGLFRADGWMADLAGTPTGFFALEQYKDRAWEEVTVVHETVHLVHASLRPEPWPDEQIGLRLLLEGLAISATHQLLPHLPERAHFDESDAWLRTCAEAEPSVKERLGRVMASDESSEMHRYFSPDWLRDARYVPPRVGYYVGARVVERLRQQLSMAELARLPAGEALDLTAEALRLADL